MAQSKLTPKQKLFIAHYTNPATGNFNATQSAVLAGYPEKSARHMGAQNLGHELIAAAIAEAFEKRTESLELDANRLLLELNRIALFDPRKLFDDQGKPKGITELDDDTIAAVAGLDVTEVIVEGVTYGSIKKWKLSDKQGAIVTLLKHLGKLTDRVQHSYDLTNLTDDELDALAAIRSKLDS